MSYNVADAYIRTHTLVIEELVFPINYVATAEQAEKIEEALTAARAEFAL